MTIYDSGSNMWLNHANWNHTTLRMREISQTDASIPGPNPKQLSVD